MWIATIVHGIPVERVRAVVRTWLRLEGLTGVCFVVAPEDHAVYAPVVAELVPKARVRWAITQAPFRRGAWRRIAAMVTPTRGNVAFVDIDCVPVAADFIAATEKALAGHPKALVVYAPSWSRQPEAEAFLQLGDAGALEMAKERSRGQWAGTVAVRRLHAVLIGWDDQLDGWGGEDFAFCQRALALGFAQTTLTGVLVHVWHPSMGVGAHPSPRSLEDKVRNVRDLRARARMLPEEHYRVALEELHGLPGVLFASLPEPLVQSTEIRWFAYSQVLSLDFPLLQKLDAGEVSADATWEPLRTLQIIDAPRA